MKKIITFFIASLSVSVYAGNIDTLQVITSTVSAAPQCLHYKVKGTCFWFHCSGFDCEITPTLKVDHYLPDAIVSVYNDKDSNPWDIGRTIIDPLAYQLGNAEVKTTLGFAMGWGQSPTNDPHDLDTHFKEVDVVGNPAITALGALGFLLLPSTATSFVPYYSSLSDASIWRSTWTEMFYPASIIPGMNEVGSFPLNDWGSVYPRTGFINQPNDAKASAVIAQRAIDIVTKTTQPHIYNPLKTGSCGDHCTVLAVKENDGNTGQFQMIYPTAENRCSVFGENDVGNPTPWKSDEAQKGNGNYVWVLWRHYEGCIKGTGKYIGQVSW